jgi:hypothetical protein
MDHPQKILREGKSTTKESTMDRATVIADKAVFCYHMVLCSEEWALVDTKNLVNTST